MTIYIFLNNNKEFYYFSCKFDCFFGCEYMYSRYDNFFDKLYVNFLMSIPFKSEEGAKPF